METKFLQKNKAYMVLAASALVLSGLLLAPALQEPNSQVHAQSAVNAYMTMDGFKGQVEIQSFSWGANNTSIGSQSSGAGAGKITFNPFSITRKVDSASPSLYAAAVSGKHFGNAVLKVGNVELDMSNGSVSSYGISLSSGNTNPTESVSFTFQKIEFKYNGN
jgi:type VI secretion system secreted protein Hcp